MPHGSITAEALAALSREQRPLIVDVREDDEWAAGHLEGARHIPLGALADRADEVPRDQPVVLMCRAGLRSAHGVALLRALGFDNLLNLEGGLDAWDARLGGQAQKSSPKRPRG